MEAPHFGNNSEALGHYGSPSLKEKPPNNPMLLQQKTVNMYSCGLTKVLEKMYQKQLFHVALENTSQGIYNGSAALDLGSSLLQ
eukprot:14300797-Ditylum_brightwellii.AAC.1